MNSEIMEYKMDEILNKTNCLVVSIKELSSRIPQEDIYRLRERLIDSISNVPAKIETGFKGVKKIDQVINLIKANSALNELKGYLTLVNELKYCNTQQLINEVEYVTEKLTADYPYLDMRFEECYK